MAAAKRQTEGEARRRVSDEAIVATILRLARTQGPSGSIGPGDAARALAPETWQALLPRVRQTAIALAGQGRLEILRKGKPADPAAFKGVYRLRIASSDEPGDASDGAG